MQKSFDLRRLRLVFMTVALLVLLPLGFLLRRALAGVAAEQSAAHRTVAERYFDEMERDLTSFLDREEVRPFEHYRATYLDPSTGLDTASPLAAPPSENFVLGHFQIAPDGTFSSPRPDTSARIASTVQELWQNESDQPDSPSRFRQAVGSTVELNVGERQKKQKLGRYLESLNRATTSRDSRASKLEQTRLSNVYDEADDAFADADSAGQEEAKEILEEEFGSRSEQEAEPAQELRKSIVVDLRLEPMVGRRTADGRLVLYRTVTVNSQAFRQGLVIDPVLWIGDLDASVVRPSAAGSSARLLLADTDAVGLSIGNSDHIYQHRFAEPFGEVSAVLTLETLPGWPVRARSTGSRCSSPSPPWAAYLLFIAWSR